MDAILAPWEDLLQRKLTPDERACILEQERIRKYKGTLHTAYLIGEAVAELRYIRDPAMVGVVDNIRQTLTMALRELEQMGVEKEEV